MAASYGITFAIGATVGASFASAFASVQDKLRATQQSFARINQQSKALNSVLDIRKKRDALAFEIKTNGGDQKLRQQLNRLNQEYRQAAQNAGVYGQSLEQLVARQNELARAAQATERRLKTLGAIQANKNLIASEKGNRQAALGNAMSGALAAYSLARPLKTGMEFEAAMSKVGAISGATGADFEKLRNQARELGATTVWSAKEAAEGMTFLSMAGFKTEQTLNAMPGMLSLASAGAMDLGTTADIASNVLSGFGFEAGKMNYVADVMAKTFTNSNTSIRSIGESMKYCAPAAAAAGQSFQDVAAMVGKLGDVGIQGSMAGTALNAIMMRMSSPPEMAANAMRALGLSMSDANGKIRALPDVFRELGAKMSGMKEIDQMDFARRIFGMEAAKAGLALMKQAVSGDLQKMSASLYEAGYATKVATKQNDNFAGDLKALNSAAEEVSICLFDVVSPALRTITNGIIPIVRATGEWIKENPRLTQGLMLLGGAFVALKAGALAFTLINSYRKTFGAGLSTLGNSAKLAVGGITGAFGRMRAELLRPINFNPSGVAMGTRTLKSRLDSLRNSASQAMTRLRQIGPSSIAAGTMAAASGTMAAAGRIGWNTLRLGIRGVGMAFKTAFGPVSLLMMGLTMGVEYVIENWSKIQPYFEDLWEGVKNIFNSVLDWLQPIIEKITSFVEPVTGTIGKIGSFIGESWDSLFGNDKEAARKEEIKKEEEKKAELRKKAELGTASDGVLKTPAQLQQEKEWAEKYANAKEDAEKKEQEKKGKKGQKSKKPVVYDEDYPDDYGAESQMTPMPKQFAKQGATAVAPQVQVAINVTQNGVPDQEFAQGVINAIKSRQAEFESIISNLVQQQARLAYGG